MTDSPFRRTPAPAPGAAPATASDELLERLRAATLGEYDIFGELGRGGMATVYLAHELALDRKVAIKVMAPALTYGPGMTERFKREARTAAHLSHPNIIPIYAVRESGDLLFFIMKLVEGTPLDSIMLELGKLPIPMVEAILAQIGGAFGYAHRRGVVHRDIKPSNILIDEEGWAVVTDFGIAKVQESEGLTQTGTSVGTPTYMSPEQCGGGEITGASDQYSLGVVAYEMLTGKPPFVGSMMALMYSHFHDPIPPIELARPDCPEPLRLAVMRMLQKDPAERWPSMEEAVAALGARHLAHDDPTRSQLILLARSGVTHKIVSQVQTPRSPVPLTRGTPMPVPQLEASAPTHRRRVWPLAAAVAAIATIGVLLWRPWASPAVPAESPGAVVPPAATPPSPAPLPPPPAAGGPGGAGVVPSPTPPSGRAAERLSPVDKRGVTSQPTAPAQQKPETLSTALAPPPAPPPPAPAPSAVTPTVVQPRPESAAVTLTPPPTRVADERLDVAASIQAYARALEAGDLALARRLYPEMPADQRQGLEAFWKAGGTMRPRWSVNDIVVTGDIAAARVVGVNNITTARDGASEQRVNLRARLERRGTEWRLVALVN